MKQIKVKKLTPFAKLPTKSYDIDAGYDFYCTSYEKTIKYIEYHTGIAIDVPKNMVGLLSPRSSVTKKDLMLKNGVGILDPGYHGEVIFRFNDTKEYTVTQKKDIYDVGDRIGQIIFIDLPEVELIQVDDLGVSERDVNGFGSTGN